MTDHTALARLDEAVAMLAAASTLEEVGHIRNMAFAAEEYARAEKLGENAEKYAREIRVRAARKLGEMLQQMKRDGARVASSVQVKSSADGTLGPTTLADLGVTRKQSHTWQRIAAVPEPEFEQKVAQGWGENAIAEGGVRQRSGPHREEKVRMNERVPLGMTHRTGLSVRVRLERIADQLAGYASVLPDMSLRDEEVLDVLEQIESNALAVRRAARRLKEGRNEGENIVSSNGAAV